jgi:hypothetical protein
MGTERLNGLGRLVHRLADGALTLRAESGVSTSLHSTECSALSECLQTPEIENGFRNLC